MSEGAAIKDMAAVAEAFEAMLKRHKCPDNTRCICWDKDRDIYTDECWVCGKRTERSGAF